MLSVSCERAEIEDGMQILELGCGWGSLTLWLGKHYPQAKVTAVSNSTTQKIYIDRKAAEQGIKNINVVTCDMNDFATDETFDRVLSIEMFEHMRNYETLFERISTWLRPTGKLWFHIFCHKNMPYFFQDDGEADWMARHFFTGGLMPSWDLPYTNKVSSFASKSLGGEWGALCKDFQGLAGSYGRAHRSGSRDFRKQRRSN